MVVCICKIFYENISCHSSFCLSKKLEVSNFKYLSDYIKDIYLILFCLNKTRLDMTGTMNIYYNTLFHYVEVVL
jgi:hypothetical protein